VGATVDFIAGSKQQAPAIVQRPGLEWFFRFLTEPRRLWCRYLYNNPRFVWAFAMQCAGNDCSVEVRQETGREPPRK